LQNYLAATGADALTVTQKDGLLRGMYCLKERAKTFPDLIEKAHFILTSRPLDRDVKALALLTDVSRGILLELTPQLQNASWDRDALEGIVSDLATRHDTKLGKLAGPLRAALAGRSVSPSVFDMMLVLGREETGARLAESTA
jgi:glutamyl-tRNA synthetase